MCTAAKVSVHRCPSLSLLLIGSPLLVLTLGMYCGRRAAKADAGQDLRGHCRRPEAAVRAGVTLAHAYKRYSKCLPLAR